MLVKGISIVKHLYLLNYRFLKCFSRLIVVVRLPDEFYNGFLLLLLDPFLALLADVLRDSVYSHISKTIKNPKFQVIVV